LRNSREQLGTGRGTTFWARQDVLTVFDYLGNYRGNLCHLVPVWLWVLPSQGMSALAACLRLEVLAGFDLLYRHQLPRCAFVAWLSPSLAFALGALARLWRNIRTVAGRRLRGVARVSVDLLTQG
jgi:hypothetical protein